jgi:predicted Zn-dependent protease
MEATAVIPQRSPVEEAVQRMRALQQSGGHEAALREAQALLADYPKNRDLLLIAAISQRHLWRIPDALATLDTLTRLQPKFSLAHQERGLCHVQQKEAQRAIEALLQAVGLNPALPMSWRMLEGVYRLVGDAENAGTAAAHVATLKALPPEVVSATQHFFDGEIAPAEQIIRAYLLTHGDEPEAMRLLAKIAVAREVLDDAETLFAAMLALAPDHHMARLEYAHTLVQRHKYAQALSETRRLLALDPQSREYRSLEASAAVGLGDHEAAIGLYRALLADTPGDPDMQLWLGHALKTVGHVPEAVEAYRSAAAARPDFGDAYWSLANLKTYRFTDEEIARMREQEALETTAAGDRLNMCFALGKALEDRGEPAESWTYYARGNALKRAESRYRPEILEANTREQAKVCTRAFFEARTGWGDVRPDPIFIVGLPRSGSTLVEQILASHSAVEGTQELSDIQRVVQALQGRDPDLENLVYPAVLADMGEEDFRLLGESYLADTRVYRTGAPFFIDKMPNNFRHVGLIHLMLPNAKIIDVRREPMSCCFSNLKQLFARGQEFTYSAEDIARYYRTYLDLMRHWDEVLPGRILRVQHEDVVADLDGSVRRILDYCGLLFEAGCIAFHENRRSVRTPSSEQVRQPIFRDGLDQWEKYAPFLGPLRAALGDALDGYRK